MRCDEAAELSLLAIDGVLDPSRAHRLERHLAGCNTCRLQHADDIEVAAALDLPIEGLAGPNLVAAVMREVAALANAGRGQPAVRLHPFADRALVPLLAAAALVLALWVAGRQTQAVAWALAAVGQARGATAALGGEICWAALSLVEPALRTFRASLGIVLTSGSPWARAIPIATAVLACACAVLVVRFKNMANREQ